MLRVVRDFSIVVSVTLALIVLAEVSISYYLGRTEVWVSGDFCDHSEMHSQDLCNSEHPLLHFLYLGWIAKGLVAPDPQPVAFDDSLDVSKVPLEFTHPNNQQVVVPPWDPENKISYDYDHLGARFDPKKKDNLSANVDLYFFGGSWVHGDFLPYEQSFPNQVQLAIENSRARNFGLQGRGITESALRLIHPQFKDDIKNEKGVFVYVYTIHHNHRMHPTLYNSVGHANHPSINYMKDGQLGFHGNWLQTYPVLLPSLAFAKLTGVARLAKLNKALLPEWPVNPMLCDQVLLFRKLAKRVRPNFKFVVLMYLGAKENPKQLEPCLEDNNIAYYSLQRSLPDLPKEVLPDGHPTARVHNLVAEGFSRYLKSTFKDLFEPQREASL